MPEENKGLSNITIGFMIIVAFIYDMIQATLQLLPILGQILASLISIFAFLTFYVWFKVKGLNFSTVKRSMYLFGGLAIEIIPIVNALPTWTLSVTLLALNSKLKKVVPGLDIIKK